MNKPKIIGITGGIGGGKTTLSKLLIQHGYLVYNSDIEAARLQNQNSFIKQKLIELFGTEIYNSDGLNRKLLGSIIFEQSDLLVKVTEIVHPIVIQDFKLWVNSNNNQDILFIESAILFESNINVLTDKIIVVTASESIRIQRVIKRDGLNTDQIMARMKHQLPEIEKVNKADFVIFTDDNIPLLGKIEKIIEEIKSSF